MLLDKPSEAASAPTPRPRLGRRISWTELYRLRPDLKPDNDNHTAAATELPETNLRVCGRSQR